MAQVACQIKGPSPFTVDMQDICMTCQRPEQDKVQLEDIEALNVYLKTKSLIDLLTQEHIVNIEVKSTCAS